MIPWRACIALVMTALFALGSVVSANPQWHAAWHHHEELEPSDSCAAHSDADSEDGHQCEHGSTETGCQDHACFLCELSTGSVWNFLADPQCVPILGDTARVRLERVIAYCKPSDRLLPPILGPPSA